MGSKLLRGTFILTLGTLLSKVLGILYVIPFYAIVGGDDPMLLYNFGYVPYQLFLSVATAGIPLAVAKYIAKYNAMEEYEIGRRLFRTGIYLMIASGIICFLAMYSLAPFLAGLQQLDGGYSLQDGVQVIRAVSFALLIIPIMSLLRGFFQGYNSMGPSAVSQVIEQLVRIVFLLVSTFVVLYVLDGSTVTAISMATFSAFVGALASLALLLWYYFKRKPGLDRMLVESRNELKVSIPTLYKQIILSAIPFIIVGSATSLYQLVDQFTLGRVLQYIGVTANQVKEYVAIINFDVQKLIMIPGTLAIAFSMALVPLVTAAYVRNEKEQVKRQLNDVFQILLFLTIPACIGIALLARPLFTVFFTANDVGTDLLQFFSPIAVLFSLFGVTAAVLQGIDEQRFTVLGLLLGLLAKSVLQMPLIMLFEAKGSILATGIGYAVSCLFMLYIIKKYVRFSFGLVFRRVVLFIFLTFIMSIAVLAVYYPLSFVLSPDHKLSATILVIICGGVGGVVYAYLSFKLHLSDKLFGPRGMRLRQKLGIK
ncbi:polysaccharide biosynthesis family membrane protein [Listeria fleischmannii 1991]|uniref:Polysaccharide biosynthesis family membrane protein n=1 Tax=Listeria fleischmannii 1991 TaxID=1430899 RepID=A0A0J8GDL1_9LIST|nr:polysaccharide biosynthesis protein [Listeria fleischmannii]EMG28973.1 polysaccharide biosynthesis family protein [Listeria fleischmannii subsp. fleischmannii LU2006-1]KMT60767.1 polysaccharide biosynthesis family membrane protein [Listeria fleischmannii 1991]